MRSAFAQTLVTKLEALNHPENTVRLGEGDTAFISEDASLYYRCEIIAAGPQLYKQRLVEPRLGTGLDGTNGEALLRLLELGDSDDSSSKIDDLEFSTDTTVREIAPDAVASEGSFEWSCGPFSYETQMMRLRLHTPIPQSLHSFVAYASHKDCVREIMGCLMAPSFAVTLSEVSAFLAPRVSDGFVLYPKLLLRRPGVDGITRGIGMVDIDRRGNWTVDEYIATFIEGVRLP
ncbi:hypothetical protein [Microbacterium sp. NIBRBAC000506063]|uniref:hypothetical protein n=1 Tax=Microbacterium sp. NIBRBAC000506063 TaxID=2734618 RepID=UPI001BB5F4E1|nr:hypothetical protein [Microbacterium sp. NIBRBAC000506063]QTV79403.1 hypothetical protein KAE78_10685 [Microbacterium sp. NIBRBAC000506063]